MGWKGALRAAEAAHRRRERDEVRRLRDLERRNKEQAKLSALEQARLEIETHESRIDLLLSIHKEPIEVRNWLELTAALDPGSPWGGSPNELSEKLSACAEARGIEAGTLEGRRADDRRALEQAMAEYAASRRLEPTDRIKELSDASVPFEFDVHAMIACDDAPKLEAELHAEFEDLRINKVNYRKEFFRLPVDRLRTAVANRAADVSFTMVAEARQYRESMALSKMSPKEREKYVENREMAMDAE